MKLLSFSYFAIFLIIQCFFLRKRILIVCDQYGRLGNRLFLFSQLIEIHRKTGREIWMPGFFDYKHYFESTKSTRFIRYPEKNIPNPFSLEETFLSFNRIHKLFKNSFLSKVIPILEYYSMDQGNPIERILSEKNRCLLFNGFIFHEYFLSHESINFKIRKSFLPSSEYEKLINEPICKLRKKNEVLCGVLVRQTDYRTWNDGKCFYSSMKYAKILNDTKIAFKNKTLSFFIATDEKQDHELYEGLDFIIRVGHPIENLYSLSKCDFLIGPPSSYVAWASLYGNIPLFTITDQFRCPVPSSLKS
jgi:hypothetical protein